MVKRSDKDLHALEEVAQSVGGLIGTALEAESAVVSGPRACFALLMFTVGEDGWSTWVSNAEREDMIRALREMADNLEAGFDLPPGSTHREQ